MILISLDLQKAYHTVWQYRVINLLKNWNLHGNMLFFLTDFLNQWSFQIKIRDEISNIFMLENRVPQGSPLSIFYFILQLITFPTLSLILLNRWWHPHIIRGMQISVMTEIFQKCLNDLFEWCFKAGFIFSPQKTECILFSNKKLKSTDQKTLKQCYKTTVYRLIIIIYQICNRVIQIYGKHQKDC